METFKSVLTIATGKRVYINMAVALARSFLWWHKNSDITFYIATDSHEYIPSELKKRIKILSFKPGELGEGFSSKLYIDRLAPTSKTLFIDADCLIYGNLDRVFKAFDGKAVSVVGGFISDGEWFGDITTIRKQFNLDQLLKFNGGIYYIEKGEIATSVYEKARALEPQYDAIGFKRLRNRPNDELLMSLAMALNGQSPLIDDGTILSDPQACPGGMYLDVLKGKSLLINPPKPDKKHQKWYPFHKVSPLVVHFLGDYTTKYPYKREDHILCMITKGSSPLWSRTLTFIKITVPFKSRGFFKDLLRPVYRSLFGFRKVKSSARI
jgi:hypothetical protein